MSNQPNGWLAALLTLIAPFLGFLYVGRWKWAISIALAQIGFSGLIIHLIPFWAERHCGQRWLHGLFSAVFFRDLCIFTLFILNQIVHPQNTVDGTDCYLRAYYL